MNGSSHPDHENLLHTIDSRFRASARHGGAGSCFEFYLPIRRGGAPSGAAAIIVSEGESGSNPRIISEYYDFHGKSSITSETLTGVSPPAAVAPPMR